MKNIEGTFANATENLSKDSNQANYYQKRV